MNRQEQLQYLKTLGLDPDKVTNKKEIELAQSELNREAARRGLNIPKDVEDKLNFGVYEITDPAEVKKAYRKLAMEHHPDQGGDPEKFKEIHHAYKMLTDPNFALQEVKSKGKGQKNLDAVFNIAITFEQAFFGDEINLTFSPLHLDDEGKLVTIGTGDVSLEGNVFKIRIKEGTSTGSQIRIPQKGMVQGDRKGDFVINFQVRSHHKFQLLGSDIHSTEQVPLDIMLTGGEKEILTMWGVQTATIPPASKPGDRILVEKCGVAKVGHHYIILEPQYPDKQELKAKDVWKKLGIKWEKFEKTDEENFDQIYEKLMRMGAENLSSEKKGSDAWDQSL